MILAVEWVIACGGCYLWWVLSITGVTCGVSMVIIEFVNMRSLFCQHNTRHSLYTQRRDDMSFIVLLFVLL